VSQLVFRRHYVHLRSRRGAVPPRRRILRACAASTLAHACRALVSPAAMGPLSLQGHFCTSTTQPELLPAPAPTILVALLKLTPFTQMAVTHHGWLVESLPGCSHQPSAFVFVVVATPRSSASPSKKTTPRRTTTTPQPLPPW
jgi:hypothetical protein